MNVAGLGLSTVYEDRALGVKSILKAAELDFDKIVFGHGTALLKEGSKKLNEEFALKKQSFKSAFAGCSSPANMDQQKAVGEEHKPAAEFKHEELVEREIK